MLKIVQLAIYRAVSQKNNIKNSIFVEVFESHARDTYFLEEWNSF